MRVRCSGEEVPDDWAERWKRFHAPVLVGGRLYVRPPWEEPAAAGVDRDRDRSRAARSAPGPHPTTRLCLELLLELERPAGSFARPRLRLGRAGDRGGASSASSRSRRVDSDRCADRGDAPERARQRRRARRASSAPTSRDAPPPAATCHGQPDAPAAAAGGGADGAAPRALIALGPARPRGRRGGGGVRAAAGTPAPDPRRMERPLDYCRWVGSKRRRAAASRDGRLTWPSSATPRRPPPATTPAPAADSARSIRSRQ